MRTYCVEPRAAWLERIIDSGVVLGNPNLSGLWNERYLVEVSAAEAETLHTYAEMLYHEMARCSDYAIESRHLCDFDLTMEDKRIISRSWETSDYSPTLFTRIDCVIDNDGRARFTGLESGFAAGLLEAATAQWSWLQESAPWSSQFNTISERLTESWREYQLIGRMIHIAYDARDRRETNIAEYVWESAVSAGVCAVATPLDALRIDDTTGSLVDENGYCVDVLIASRDRGQIGTCDLWKNTSAGGVCLVEPHWKRLWLMPQWLPYFERFVRVSEAANRVARVAWNAPNKLICSLWIVAGTVSGLGFSHIVRNGHQHVREFIPHILLTE